MAAAEPDSGCGAGTSSADYPNYDSHIAGLRRASFDTLLDGGTIWVGTPDDVKEQMPPTSTQWAGSIRRRCK